MNYVAVIGGKIKPKPLIERAKTLTTCETISSRRGQQSTCDSRFAANY